VVRLSINRKAQAIEEHRTPSSLTLVVTTRLGANVQCTVPLARGLRKERLFGHGSLRSGPSAIQIELASSALTFFRQDKISGHASTAHNIATQALAEFEEQSTLSDENCSKFQVDASILSHS
jgi:hypothetical protein